MDILLKRGIEANLHNLQEGEPAFTTDTKRLIVGSSLGNIQLAESPLPSRVISLEEKGSLSSDASVIVIQNSEFDFEEDTVVLSIDGQLQSKDTDYTVDATGVNKVTGSWLTGTEYIILIFKSVPYITNGQVPVTYYENRVTLGSDTPSVSLGITGYNMDTDILLVFMNSDKLLKDTDFTIDSDDQISIISGYWVAGTVFDFIVIKAKLSLSDFYDGRALLEKSVAFSSFDDSLQSTINNIGVIVDDITGDKYVWAARDGQPYLKVIEVNT